uniref:uncharacterized protein n=1 Tax=Semicossyphus pulcher TaxID=241346 RepID=UPI0037E73034
MSSEGAEPAVGPRLHRLSSWFDPETAAVVTILLGLFQVLLSVPLSYAGLTLPKFFILPLVLGIIIVAGGSLTVANERNPSRLLLQGCACSNVLGLLGATLAFCLYIHSLISMHKYSGPCFPPSDMEYRRSYRCPGEVLVAHSWSVTLLLLLYDAGAVFLHCLLSVSALRALKTD